MQTRSNPGLLAAAVNQTRDKLANNVDSALAMAGAREPRRWPPRPSGDGRAGQDRSQERGQVQADLLADD